MNYLETLLRPLLLTFSFVFCLYLPIHLSADESPIAAFLANIETLTADFEQTVYDETQTVLETSTGVFNLQKPGKFRWQYQQPYQQLIVANGKKIWIYEADLNQVMIKDYQQAIQNTPVLLFSGQHELSDYFNIEDLEWDAQQADQRQVKLTAKAEDSGFKSMLITFVDQMLMELSLQDNLGQRTLIRFSKQHRNPSLSADLFEFTPPAKADIIDGR